MTSLSYSIHARWNARVETPDALARRFTHLLDRLKPLHPAFDGWWWGGREEPVAFDAVRHDLANATAQRVVRGDWGEPLPLWGYNLSVLNRPRDHDPVGFIVSLTSGSGVRNPSVNSATIRTNSFVDPDPAIVRYDIWRSALLALVECFDVDLARAYPSDLMPLWSKQKYCTAWMYYLCPLLASMVKPPSTAIVDYQPRGGLLMAATDQTFFTKNPAHLAVARDIEAALAPLNSMTD